MASVKGKIVTEPEPQVTAEDEQEVMSPLRQVAAAMTLVAEGGSAAPLRELVARVMPSDPQEAETFMTVLQRLRSAGEVAHTAAVGEFASASGRRATTS